MFKFIVALLAIVGASAFRSAAPARMGSSLQMKSASKVNNALFSSTFCKHEDMNIYVLLHFLQCAVCLCNKNTYIRTRCIFLDICFFSLSRSDFFNS